jgi:16S rRNA (cytosine967-C5)-methyltransferase
LKWRFTLEDLQEIKAIQGRILQNAARLVKPGGRLVYVTCSVFPDENFWQVKQFLGGNPNFRVEAPDNLWNKHLLARDGMDACLVLSPHKDGTDGFFAAVLLNDAAAS